jgi:peptidyl-prolyl cis-trans isomerase A (cyclophilin A)
LGVSCAHPIREVTVLIRNARIVPALLALVAGGFAVVARPQQSAAPVAPDEVTTPAATPALPQTTTVVLQTTAGDIHVALEIQRAPITAGNFLRYVDNKRFDGSHIYRAYKVSEDGKYGLVQGGLQGNSRLLFKGIAHESPQATGLSHVDGAISMAREAPGTATADFFFVIGDLVSMDGKPDGDPGYAVFGRVTQGMDVLRSMLDLPRSAEARNPVMKGQMLAAPVKILTVRRAPQPQAH